LEQHRLMTRRTGQTASRKRQLSDMWTTAWRSISCAARRVKKREPCAE